MSFISSIQTLFTPDSPVTLVADWFLNKADRQRIDAQILACQEQIAYSLRGQITTEVMLHSSSAAGNIGDCVCSAAVAADESDPLRASRYVTLALNSPMTTAGVVAGILVTPAIPGGWARIAIEGIVGPAITGLGTTAGPVRLNGANSRCYQVATLVTGQFPIGYVDSAGNLTLARGLAIP